MLPPPKFWQDKEGSRHLLARALKPVASLYRTVGERRLRTAIPYRATGPVICIGNVSMGGVGKTPFALMTARLLKQHGHRPAFLTRGYGGKLKGPDFIRDGQDVADTGDEALLLVREGMTCISADREEGARKVFGETDATVLIMDDGFQNPSLVKDFSVLLIDAETGFGNGAVFPSGPLRETPEAARERAHMIVFVVPGPEDDVPEALVRFAGPVPSAKAWLAPEQAGAPEKVLAFCGIGRPAKFYRSLEEAGYEVVETKAFPDHHAYRPGDLAALEKAAVAKGLALITTEKDHVRLPAGFQDRVLTLPVIMRLDKEPDFAGLLLKAAGEAPMPQPRSDKDE